MADNALAPPARLAKYDHEQALSSYYRVRLALGLLGLFLPALLVVHGYFIGDAFKPSISHFYHSSVGDVLVGALCAIGVFLVAYRNYQPNNGHRSVYGTFDWWLTTAAGLGAVGVALMPVDPVVIESCRSIVRETTETDCASGFIGHSHFLGFDNGGHFAAAALFFGCIALLCFVVFTDRKGPRRIELETEGRQDVEIYVLHIPHSLIYWACGLIILTMIGFIIREVVLAIEPSFILFGREITWFFIYEAVAVLAFACAWLLKSSEFKPLLPDL